MPQLFSVIIPTLQKSSRLRPLVDLYCSHGLVGEVIIINNAPEPLVHDHPKVRILQQEQNIYVNPAWNMGAREARHPLLAISNDDILPSPRIIAAAARLLKFPVGIIGPSSDSFTRERDGVPWWRPVYLRPGGFGTLMWLITVEGVEAG